MNNSTNNMLDRCMKMERAWAMPNRATFEIEPIARFVGKYMVGQWLDPFARDSRFSRFCVATNDISESANTTHHMDALDFLRLFDGHKMDGVLFDPPYSPRQISECYKQNGMAVHMKDTQSSFYSDRKDAASKCIKSVAHGGAHNDTICVAEQKRHDLFS